MHSSNKSCISWVRGDIGFMGSKILFELTHGGRVRVRVLAILVSASQ